MFKKIIVFIFCLQPLACFSLDRAVFVSFSMPEKLMQETLKEAADLKITAYLNGLYHNSMEETVKKIMFLSQENPKLSLAIDPTLFEKYKITKVPALVVENEEGFDVIYGNLSLKEGLDRMHYKEKSL